MLDLIILTVAFAYLPLLLINILYSGVGNKKTVFEWVKVCLITLFMSVSFAIIILFALTAE